MSEQPAVTEAGAASAPSRFIRVPAGRLRAFVASALGACGVPGGDAETVAGCMVEGDLWGLDTHGTFRLAQYVRRLKDGGTNARADIRVVRDEAATGLVDGDNGLGHLAVLKATEMAMDKADRFGIGWVGVRNGNHAGPATIYVMRPAARDQIGLYGAAGSANHVPPHGGAELLLGTNPIAIAVPAMDEPPFLLDMATTVASSGRIKTLAQRGETMPVGWMIERDGTPLTDPSRQSEGFLVPIGGPKGYGLAVAIGMLASVLNGAAFGRDVVEMSGDTVTPANTGQFIAAIRISAFADVDHFKREVDRGLRDIKASRPLPGHGPVRVSGEGRPELHRDRSQNGIPLHPNLIAALDGVAAELAIARLET
jgi:LDH2 family malate/lactate/ureidoglycolate dehydrogenase